MRYKIKFPARTPIMTRAGHLNNAYYQSAFPHIYPNEQEVDNMYEQLNLSENECAYCGRHFEKLDSDHLHPLVNKEGNNVVYLTDITNIIPCCPECNNKKSNKEFIDFYTDTDIKDYLFKCGLSNEKYKDRLKRISEYYSKSRCLNIDNESEVLKKFLLTCKDEYCKLLEKAAIKWGNDIMTENGLKQFPVDDKNKFTEEDFDKLIKIGDILGINMKDISIIKEKVKFEKEQSLW